MKHKAIPYIICLTTPTGSSTGSLPRSIHSLWKGYAEVDEGFFEQGDKMSVGKRKAYLKQLGYVRIR